MNMNETVGKRIANILEKKGWTQVKLAEKLNVSRQVMNNIIKGRKNVTVAEIKKIADILGVSTDDLTKPFAEQEQPEPIMAFMGEVDTEAAKEGLNKAEEVMDMIMFHERTKKKFEEMMS